MQGLAGEPLRFHPGTHWLYSWSTDVCARLVEVISGQAFDEYLQAAVFDPLGMGDTGFHVQEEDVDRLAALYTRNADKRLSCSTIPRPARCGASRRCCSEAVAWWAPPTTTCASARCCSTAASARACGCWVARPSS